jgi:hypothetical protein
MEESLGILLCAHMMWSAKNKGKMLNWIVKKERTKRGKYLKLIMLFVINVDYLTFNNLMKITLLKKSINDRKN